MSTDPKKSAGGGERPEIQTQAAPARGSAVVTSQGHAARMLAAAPDEQISAALAAGKHERAADLMQRHGERLLAGGAEADLVRWFEQLPNALVQKSPRLAVLHAWLLVYREQYPGAATRIREAERGVRALEMGGARRWPEDGEDVVQLSPFAEVKRSIRALRAHLAWIHGELDPSELPASVDEMMLPSSAEHPVWRARALVTLGRCRYLAGSLAEAAQDLDAAISCTSVSGQRAARAVELEARVGLGRVREAQARLHDAAQLYAQVVKDAKDAPELADAVAAARIGQGRVALAQRDLDAAEEALSVGIARVDETSWLSVALDGLVANAWVLYARGRYAAARAALDRADSFVKSRDRRWAAETIALHRVQLMLAHGDLPGVRRWQQAFAMRAMDHRGPVADAQRVTQGLVAMALGDPDAAAPLLAEARLAATESGLVGLAIEAAVAEARCQLARDARKEAAVALATAVALAAPASIIHPFVALGSLPEGLVAALPEPSNEAERALVVALRAFGGGAEATPVREPGAVTKKTTELRPGASIATAHEVPVPAPADAPEVVEEATAEEAPKEAGVEAAEAPSP